MLHIMLVVRQQKPAASVRILLKPPYAPQNIRTEAEELVKESPYSLP